MPNKGPMNKGYTWKRNPPPSINAPRVKTISDMTEEEIQALERQYNAPIQRPKKRLGQEK
jgi:hypothetical protein